MVKGLVLEAKRTPFEKWNVKCCMLSHHNTTTTFQLYMPIIRSFCVTLPRIINLIVQFLQ